MGRLRDGSVGPTAFRDDLDSKFQHLHSNSQLSVASISGDDPTPFCRYQPFELPPMCTSACTFMTCTQECREKLYNFVLDIIKIGKLFKEDEENIGELYV